MLQGVLLKTSVRPKNPERVHSGPRRMEAEDTEAA